MAQSRRTLPVDPALRKAFVEEGAALEAALLDSAERADSEKQFWELDQESDWGGVMSEPSSLIHELQQSLCGFALYPALMNDDMVKLCLREFRALQAGGTAPINRGGAEFRFLAALVGSAHCYFLGMPRDKIVETPLAVRRSSRKAVEWLQQLLAEGATTGVDDDDKNLRDLLTKLWHTMSQRKSRDDDTTLARSWIGAFASRLQFLFRMDAPSCVPVLRYFAMLIGVEVADRSIERYAEAEEIPWWDKPLIRSGRKRRK